MQRQERELLKLDSERKLEYYDICLLIADKEIILASVCHVAFERHEAPLKRLSTWETVALSLPSLLTEGV